jgi:hypothetical protein
MNYRAIASYVITQPFFCKFEPDVRPRISFLPAAASFNAAGESWTLSMLDASNYAVFLHDIPRAKRIVERVMHEAQRLGVEEVVMPSAGTPTRPSAGRRPTGSRGDYRSGCAASWRRWMNGWGRAGLLKCCDQETVDSFSRKE